MKSIFVGNLNFSTSEGALLQLFAAFGPVNQVKIMMDSYTGNELLDRAARIIVRTDEAAKCTPCTAFSTVRRMLKVFPTSCG